MLRGETVWLIEFCGLGDSSTRKTLVVVLDMFLNLFFKMCLCKSRLNLEYTLGICFWILVQFLLIYLLP